MKLYAILDRETVRVWELSLGCWNVGSGARADLVLDSRACPDLLCRVEVLPDRLVISELGEAEIRNVEGDPGFRAELANGESLTVGEWRLCAVADPVRAELFVGQPEVPTTPTAGSDDIAPPTHEPLLLRIQQGRKVQIIEATAGLVLGRDERCHYLLDHLFVSAAHAKIVDTTQGLAIEDLGSTHGTFVNGVPAVKDQPILLKPSFLIEITRRDRAPRIEVLSQKQLLAARAKDPEVAIIGESAVMQALLVSAEELTRGRVPILLLGESGTGKELLARFVASLWAPGKVFIPIDCGALQPQLVESELFGHEKGAFTGADKRVGLLQASSGGVAFLDEIGELPLALQPTLLRAMQEGEIRPVGSSTYQKVDLRMIFATHRDLDELVREGRFRADLRNRIGDAVLRIPPLRERLEDIPALAMHSLGKLKAQSRPLLSREAENALMGFSWPGNVRELLHVVEIAALRTRSLAIDEATVRTVLAEKVAAGRGVAPAPLRHAKAAGEALERSLVEEGLRRFGGNWKKAWAALGYESESTFYRRLKRWKLV